MLELVVVAAVGERCGEGTGPEKLALLVGGKINK